MSGLGPSIALRAALLPILLLAGWMLSSCSSAPPPQAPPPVDRAGDELGLGIALWTSSQTCNIEDVSKLLMAGAPVDIKRGAHKSTPLMETVGSYDNKCPKTLAEMLIKAGADPNARDARGWTPLHYLAAGHCIETSTEALLYLIRAGADPTLMDRQGMTPLDLATRANCSDSVGILAAHLQELNKARKKATQAPWRQSPAERELESQSSPQNALPWQRGGPPNKEPAPQGTPQDAAVRQVGGAPAKNGN